MGIRKKILVAILVVAGGFLLAIPTYRYIPPQAQADPSPLRPGIEAIPIRHHTPIQANSLTSLPVDISSGVNPILVDSSDRPRPGSNSLLVPRPGPDSPLDKEAPLPSLAASYQSGTDKVTSYKPIIPASRRATVRAHRIVDGDSLEGLAERYLGDVARAHEIFELNQNVLASPTVLPIGVSLKIPPPPR